MTTDPQAEVLFAGVIPNSYITDIWVEDKALGIDLDRWFIEEIGHEIDVTIAPIEPRHANKYTKWG